MRKTIFLMFQYGWILKLGLITTATVFSTKNGIQMVLKMLVISYQMTVTDYPKTCVSKFNISRICVIHYKSIIPAFFKMYVTE